MCSFSCHCYSFHPFWQQCGHCQYLNRGGARCPDVTPCAFYAACVCFWHRSAPNPTEQMWRREIWGKKWVSNLAVFPCRVVTNRYHNSGRSDSALTRNLPNLTRIWTYKSTDNNHRRDDDSKLISMVQTATLNIDPQLYHSFPASLNLTLSSDCFTSPVLAILKQIKVWRITPFFRQDDKGIVPSSDLSCSPTQLKCVDSLQQDKNSPLYKHDASVSQTV